MTDPAWTDSSMTNNLNSREEINFDVDSMRESFEQLDAELRQAQDMAEQATCWEDVQAALIKAGKAIN